MTYARQKSNHNRFRILENGYLELKDRLPISKRNKEIVTEYVAGKSYVELSKKHSLSSARIGAIVSNYVRLAINYSKK